MRIVLSYVHNYHLVYSALFKNKNNVKKILEIGIGTNNTKLISNMGQNGIPGASLRAFTVTVIVCESESCPSVTTIVNISVPLKSAIGVNVILSSSWLCIYVILLFPPVISNIRISPSTSSTNKSSLLSLLYFC